MHELADRRTSKWIGRLMGWAAMIWAVCALVALPVWAQEEELSLSISKQFGYNMGSQIQGTFKIRVRGPADLATVTFLLDGETIGTATVEPFTLSFDTDDYAPGWHEVAAVGTTSDGRMMKTRALRFQFVSAEVAGKSVAKIVGPLLGLILIVSMAMGILPLLTGRKHETGYDPSTYTPGEPRDYGILGGTVCPRCGRPFGIHWWGLNVNFVGKFDRCPHCGKWSLVRRANRETLIEAEAAEYAAHVAMPPRPSVAEREKLHEQLEDSRFTDHIG